MATRLKGETIYVGAFPSINASDGTTAGELRTAHAGAMEAVGRLSAETVRIEADERLSDHGKREALEEVARRERATIRRLRQRVAVPAREVLNKKRQELQPFRADPQDAAAALLRMEVRSHLRSLDPGARRSLLERGGVFVEAALELPELSGVADDHARALRARAVEATQPKALQEVEELESALAASDLALDRAEAAVMRMLSPEARREA